MPGTNPSGPWGEALAAELLVRKGYEIVETNYRSRYGEIDVIARDGQYLVFAEVKLRKSDEFGEAREFVSPGKQQRIRRTALFWLSCHSCELQPRFDVIEIYAPQATRTRQPIINHLEDAFT